MDTSMDKSKTVIITKRNVMKMIGREKEEKDHHSRFGMLSF